MKVFLIWNDFILLNQRLVSKCLKVLTVCDVKFLVCFPIRKLKFNPRFSNVVFRNDKISRQDVLDNFIPFFVFSSHKKILSFRSVILIHLVNSEKETR